MNPQPQVIHWNIHEICLGKSMILECEAINPNHKLVTNFIKRLSEEWQINATKNQNVDEIREDILDVIKEEHNFNPEIYNEEGYILKITKDKISCISSGLNGIFYCFQTLISIITQNYKTDKKEIWIPMGEIKDWPDFSWRSYEIDISSAPLPNKDLIKSWIEQLAQIRCNYVILKLGDLINCSKHPRIGEKKAFEIVDFIELDKFAQENFITLIPEFSLLSEVNHILYLPEYREFAEYPGSSSFSIGNGNVYSLLDDLVGETIPGFTHRIVLVNFKLIPDIGRGNSKDLIQAVGMEKALLQYSKKVLDIFHSSNCQQIVFKLDPLQEWESLINSLNAQLVSFSFRQTRATKKDLDQMIRHNLKILIELENPEYEIFSQLRKILVKYKKKGKIGQIQGIHGKFKKAENDIFYMNNQSECWNRILGFAWNRNTTLPKKERGSLMLSSPEQDNIKEILLNPIDFLEKINRSSMKFGDQEISSLREYWNSYFQLLGWESIEQRFRLCQFCIKQNDSNFHEVLLDNNNLWVPNAHPNTPIHLRLVFRLDEFSNEQGKAFLQVIPGNYAIIYLNGQFIGEAFSQKKQKLLEADKEIGYFYINPFLQSGTNILGIEAYNFMEKTLGVNIYGEIHQGKKILYISSANNWTGSNERQPTLEWCDPSITPVFSAEDWCEPLKINSEQIVGKLNKPISELAIPTLASLKYTKRFNVE